MHKRTVDIALQHPSTVLCLSGLDPSGGAGLQADIESCAAAGAHALVAVTVLTLQNSRDVHAVQPVSADWFDAQIRHLHDDCRIDAIKMGVLGSPEQVAIAADWIRRLQVPVVLDPVLRAGGGASLAGQPVATALVEQLLPLATVCTPNAAEARLLSGEQDADAAAAALGALGCPHVLVTGGDEADSDCIDRYWHDGRLQRQRRPRLAMGFHGAGCTLASTIAALLAQGRPAERAIADAAERLQGWLRQPKAIGGGRPSPGRVP